MAIVDPSEAVQMKKTRPASKSSAPKSESVRRKKSRFWNIASDFDGALALHENPRARMSAKQVFYLL